MKPYLWSFWPSCRIYCTLSEVTVKKKYLRFIFSVWKIEDYKGNLLSQSELKIIANEQKSYCLFTKQTNTATIW